MLTQEGWQTLNTNVYCDGVYDWLYWYKSTNTDAGGAGRRSTPTSTVMVFTTGFTGTKVQILT
jgi:hypothetical protein